MRPSKLVKLALRSIRRNVVRSSLTMLGVVIGVGSVVLMVAVGQGAQSEIQARIDGLGSNLVVVTPGSAARGGVSAGAGSFNRLTVEDAELVAREAATLAGVTPVVFTRSNVIGGQGNWRTMIHGVDASYFQIRAWPVAQGRAFVEEEVRGRRRVCLLGASVAEAMFGGDDPVGQTVRLGEVPFEIVGVLRAKGQLADGSDQDDVILAPHTTVRTRLSGRQFIAQILASALSEREIPAAMAEVRALMRESHGLAEWEDDDFEVRDQSQLAETARSTTEVMTWLLSAIAGISLVVGGIGIMNIMLVSVTERTREIGIRRALGARRGDVAAQFLVESVVLSGLGGLVGALLGSGGALGLRLALGWATTVTPATLALALAFSGAVGVFFGWYPARRAARLDPIEALRHQ